MWRSYVHLFILLVGTACAMAPRGGASSQPTPQHAQEQRGDPPRSARRYALLIGNAEYLARVQLGYPASDVDRIASSLARAGFKTFTHLDLTGTEISDAVSKLTSTLGPDDEVFFYFSGLALSLGRNKQNYLLGTRFSRQDLWADPETVDAIRLDSLVKQFDDSQARSRVIAINSACDSYMSGSRNYGDHTLVAQSGTPSTLLSISVAKEKLRLERNASSPFANAVARGIERPNASVRDVLANAAVASYRDTGGLHTTVVDGSLAGELFFGRTAPPNLNPEAKPELPSFPWPVPRPSARLALPQGTVSELLGKDAKALTLRQVSDKLGSLANRAGYSEKRFFRFGTDGFAMMTRIERFERNGRPYPPPRRFTGPGVQDSFTLTEFLKALFIAPVGFYRVIVMVVTPTPGYPISQETLEATTAEVMMAHAPARLHGDLSDIPFSSDYGIDVLVYEFQRREQTKPKMLQDPILPVETHLTSTRFLTVDQLRR